MFGLLPPDFECVFGAESCWTEHHRLFFFSFFEVSVVVLLGAFRTLIFFSSNTNSANLLPSVKKKKNQDTQFIIESRFYLMRYYVTLPAPDLHDSVVYEYEYDLTKRLLT